MSSQTKNKHCGPGPSCGSSQAIPRPDLADRPDEAALLERLLQEMPNPGARVDRVALGGRFLAVRTTDGIGLASTLGAVADDHARRVMAELEQGELADYAALLLGESPFLASLGLAALNAAYPPPDQAPTLPAGDLLAALCRDQKVAVVGDFPFVGDLRQTAASLTVLDLRPGRGDQPPPDPDLALADCRVAAISATTLLTRALHQMMTAAHRAVKVLVGPSTPWAPALLEAGADVLAGSSFTDPDAVMEAVAQGLPFRDIKRRGVRLALWAKPGVVPDRLEQPAD